MTSVKPQKADSTVVMLSVTREGSSRMRQKEIKDAGIGRMVDRAYSDLT